MKWTNHRIRGSSPRRRADWAALGMTCRKSVALACMMAMLLAAPRQGDADEAPAFMTPYGPLSISLPWHGEGQIPAVLILADHTGPDGREVPYVDYLLAAGIAVIQLGTDSPGEAAPLLAPSALRAIADRLAPGRLDLARIGLLGFGAGGRAALATIEAPVAALYPVCTGLPPGRRLVATLLLHPEDPVEAAACRGVDRRAEAVSSDTHGWDHGQGPEAGWTAMLPHPDGSKARLFARSDEWATQESVARVVRHFRDAFSVQDPEGAQGASLRQR